MNEDKKLYELQDKIIENIKNDILKEGRDSYLDVKDMLIEEGVIDKNRYDELLEEKAEFDKNEEIARKNIEKLMEDDRKGKVDGYDLYLQDEDSEFYNYVEDLQTIKSDSKYKNFNFEFNVERAAKVRELTKPSNAVVEDEDANEDDVELSIKQACFENIIRKMTEQNKGMER